MSKLKRRVKRMWWDIKDIAFNGTNITRKNGMFMSTANSIPVGSIFELKRSFGRFRDQDLQTSYDTLKSKYTDCPNVIEGHVKSPSYFTLDTSSKAGLDIASSFTDSSQLNKISKELSILINKAKKIECKITKWGIDYIEEDEFALFFARYLEINDDRINRLLDGDNYIATRGIWISGIQMSSDIDEEVLAKVKAIYESNKEALIDAKIDFNFSQSLNLSYKFDFNDKFYPFLKFRKIKVEKKGDYIDIASAELPNNDVFLDDIDMTMFSV